MEEGLISGDGYRNGRPGGGSCPATQRCARSSSVFDSGAESAHLVSAIGDDAQRPLLRPAAACARHGDLCQS